MVEHYASVKVGLTCYNYYFMCRNPRGMEKIRKRRSVSLTKPWNHDELTDIIIIVYNCLTEKPR